LPVGEIGFDAHAGSQRILFLSVFQHFRVVKNLVFFCLPASTLIRYNVFRVLAEDEHIIFSGARTGGALWLLAPGRFQCVSLPRAVRTGKNDDVYLSARTRMWFISGIEWKSGTPEAKSCSSF